MSDTPHHLAGIPAHLLNQRVRLWIDGDAPHGIVETAESFFGRCDPDVIDYEDIAETLLVGRTYRDGGGAEGEWTVMLADRVKWIDDKGWVPDYDAGCRADIANGLHGVLADARAGIRRGEPTAKATALIRRQIASCVAADERYVEYRTNLLVDNIDRADLRNEAERMADWVHPAILTYAARFAVADLRGRM